jgi:hypothetical protein
MTQRIVKTDIEGRDGLGNTTTFSYNPQSDQLVAMHPDGHWLPMRSPTGDERERIFSACAESNEATELALATKIRELTAAHFSDRFATLKSASRTLMAIEAEATRVLSNSL